MTNKNVEYITIKLKTGKEVTVPIFNEAGITVGLRRKTRSLKDDELQEEFFWSYLEAHLTDKQLTTIDGLTEEELQEVTENMSDKNENTGEKDPKA